MTVTHDQILALLVLKDTRILALEAKVESLEAMVSFLEAQLRNLKEDSAPAGTD